MYVIVRKQRGRYFIYTVDDNEYVNDFAKFVEVTRYVSANGYHIVDVDF